MTDVEAAEDWLDDGRSGQLTAPARAAATKAALPMLASYFATGADTLRSQGALEIAADDDLGDLLEFVQVRVLLAAAEKLDPLLRTVLDRPSFRYQRVSEESIGVIRGRLDSVTYLRRRHEVTAPRRFPVVNVVRSYLLPENVMATWAALSVVAALKRLPLHRLPADAPERRRVERTTESLRRLAMHPAFSDCTSAAESVWRADAHASLVDRARSRIRSGRVPNAGCYEAVANWVMDFRPREVALDPALTLTTDGRITDVNRAMEEASGLPREKLIGSNFTEYFTEPDKARAGYLQVLREGTVHDYPLTLRQVSGSTMDVLYHATTYKNESGELQGVYAAARDITVSKRAQTEMNRLHAEIEQQVVDRTAELAAANKELEAFAYSVSHDLRAPLRAVDGFARILSKEYAGRLDAEGQRLLRVVRDSAQKMGQLIDDLLAFSRMGRHEMASADIDMTVLARDVADGLRKLETARTIEIAIAPLPPTHGDPAMMRQAWFNLLSNAIKFTRPRSPAHIEVGGRVEGRENIYWVKDNGVGFDMQYVDKLFGVFQRLHGPEEFEGTGVGLALVQRIVHRHGGRIWAEAQLNEGATFCFALPNQPA